MEEILYECILIFGNENKNFILDPFCVCEAPVDRNLPTFQHVTDGVNPLHILVHNLFLYIKPETYILDSNEWTSLLMKKEIQKFHVLASSCSADVEIDAAQMLN